MSSGRKPHAASEGGSMLDRRLKAQQTQTLVRTISRNLEPLARDFWQSLPYQIQASRIQAFKTGNRSWSGLIAEIRHESDPR